MTRVMYRQPGPEQVGCYMPVGSLRAIKVAATRDGQTPGEWLRSIILAELARSGCPVTAAMPVEAAE